MNGKLYAFKSDMQNESKASIMSMLQSMSILSTSQYARVLVRPQPHEYSV